jgi:hypothetical protein
VGKCAGGRDGVRRRGFQPLRYVSICGVLILFLSLVDLGSDRSRKEREYRHSSIEVTFLEDLSGFPTWTTSFRKKSLSLCFGLEMDVSTVTI